MRKGRAGAPAEPAAARGSLPGRGHGHRHCPSSGAQGTAHPEPAPTAALAAGPAARQPRTSVSPQVIPSCPGRARRVIQEERDALAPWEHGPYIPPALSPPTADSRLETCQILLGEVGFGQGEGQDMGREQRKIGAGNGQDSGRIGAGLGWDLGSINHSCPSAPLATGCSLPAPSALPVQARPWHHVNPCVYGQLPGKQFHSPQDARSAHPHAPRRHKTPAAICSVSAGWAWGLRSSGETEAPARTRMAPLSCAPEPGSPCHESSHGAGWGPAVPTGASQELAQSRYPQHPPLGGHRMLAPLAVVPRASSTRLQ